MTNSEIKQMLIDNDVQYLYHTNTVETSISFLKSGGLLSRGLCEDLNLPQTYQYTDGSDRRFNIYYDIFFDSIEIQRRTGYSYYGPVLFVYDIDVLDTVDEGNIRITKKNPEKWISNTSQNERYFQSLDELSLGFVKGDFGQHITLVNQRQALSFDYLRKIVISNPQKDDNYLFKTAKSAIEMVIEDELIDVPFCIRDYSYYDRFHEAYSNEQTLKAHFSLGGNK